MIRKFYDASPAEATATDTGEKTISLAEAMAKHGVHNNTGDMVATPIEITEKKEEPTTTQEPEKAATANEVVKVEEKASETPSPADKPEVATQPQKAEEPQKVQTWQEVLKSQQPDTVLKELGYDEKAVEFIKDLKELDPKMLAFLNHWKTNGNVTDYLKELSTDYLKMPAEQVMRNYLKTEYPKASDAQLDILYKNKIVEQYKIDPEKYSDDEVEEGRLLLEAEADKHRDSFVAKQQEYLIPKSPEPKATHPDQRELEKEQAILEIQKQVKEDSYTKSFIESKAFTLGEGEEKFTYPVDPNKVLDVLINGDVTGELMFDIEKDANGNPTKATPKTQHQILISTVKTYGIDFINKLAEHYRTLGGRKIIAPIENAKQPDNTTVSPAEAAPKSLAEGMARYGRHNSGGN